MIELAISLLILTLLAGGAISILKTQMAYSRIAETREQLREAQQTLLNYASANQVLPCPANNADGIQNSPCDSSAKGYLPWRALGITATDAWGQPLRYAVTPSFTQPNFALDTLGSLTVYSDGVDIDAKYHAIAFAVWSIGEDAKDNSKTDPQIVGTDAPGSDDLIEWTSRYALFGQMLTAGRTLPVTGSGGSSSSSSSSSSSGG